MFVMPPPSLPSRFSAGTRQSSKISSHIVDARMPSFGIFGLVEKPANAALDDERRDPIVELRVDEERRRPRGRS